MRWVAWSPRSARSQIWIITDRIRTRGTDKRVLVSSLLGGEAGRGVENPGKRAGGVTDEREH